MRTKIFRWILIGMTLLVSVSSMARKSSINMTVDVSSESDAAIKMCQDDLQSLMANRSEFEKETNLKLAIRNVWVFRRKTSESLDSVMLDFRNNKRIRISLREYVTGERGEDAIIRDILKVLKQYFDEGVIEIDSPLGPISS